MTNTASAPVATNTQNEEVGFDIDACKRELLGLTAMQNHARHRWAWRTSVREVLVCIASGIVPRSSKSPE